MGKTILIDGDSIAYMAGIAETSEDCFRIVDEYMDRIKNRTWEGRYELYVEGASKNLFRNHVATTKPYKGNRSDTERPPFLLVAKGYMFEHYGAQCEAHLESEDLVAIRAYEYGLENVIIASIDKDMLQIPAEFYNYVKDEQFMLIDIQSIDLFWTQVLTGDATDNIPGLHRVGPETARKIMDKMRGKTIVESQVDFHYCVHVAKEYARRSHPYQYFVEQCRLLRMLRSREEVYNPPISQEMYNDLLTELSE